MIYINEENKDISPANCKCYTIEEFQSQNDKHFSILHLNISSVEFQIILELLKHKFDFMCISESKIRTNSELTVDITIQWYQQPIGMSTDAEQGRGLIYIKEGIN